MDIDPTKAVEYIMKYSGDFAKAKANRIYLENFLKSKRSILMSKSSAKSVAAAEVDAYADPEYKSLLDGLKEAVECEEKIKWMLTAAQLKVEIWRSLEATNRSVDNHARQRLCLHLGIDCVSYCLHFYKDWYKIVDSTNYNLYLNKYKEMLKTAHHLSQLLKKTREENAMLRAELDKKTGLEGNH